MNRANGNERVWHGQWGNTWPGPYYRHDSTIPGKLALRLGTVLNFARVKRDGVFKLKERAVPANHCTLADLHPLFYSAQFYDRI